MKSMTHPITRSRMCGFNMVELMVAMAIGLVLSGAGITVYVNTRTTIDVNQAVSRLQENARYAIDELTRDLRLSGYWGHNNSAEYVDNRTNQSGALPGPTGDCLAGWYNDLDNRVQGLDDTNDTWTTCIPDASYSPGGDVLAMRFVDPTPIAAIDLKDNTQYLRSGRNWGQLFTGTVPPTTPGQNYRVASRAYYVRPFTTAGDGIPALVRVVQPDTGGALQSEVVISGVENLQVQYAVDNDAWNTDGYGSVDQYLNGDGAVTWSQVEAVRLWVLVRADT
ncbi:MAG: PilW family protein, partial [Gammaproteobacteria bacterium]